MGVVRRAPPVGIGLENHSPALTGAALMLQAAWLAGVFLRIPVLQELGFWPAVIAPAVAVFAAPHFASALRASVITAITIPAAVVLLMLAALCIGAAIAWSRHEPIEWLTGHWQDVLQKNLGSFPDTWMHLLGATAPFGAIGLLGKMIIDLFRRN